ncbi:MAG: hypothetical protein WCE75_06815 [Terracidiphilus sp.]
MDSLLRMVAAPFAALFLVLALGALAPRQPAQEGVRLDLLREGPEPSDCGVDRLIVVHTKPDGSVWLNEEQYQPDVLAARMVDIEQGRKYKGAYFFPDDSASIQQVAELAARMQAAVPGLHLAILTPQQREKEVPGPFGPAPVRIGCMRWPALEGAATGK